jgi:glycosyltransferase involved in cell wall biosynthesis
MKITFLLPDANLAGGVRVVAIYAQQLQQRGHSVTLVSTPRRVPDLRGRLLSLVQGKGWPTARRGPSHLDTLDLEHRVIDRYRPMTDADVPDADVVVATWWETAEWMMNLSPAKGAKVHFVQHDETHLTPQKQRVEKTWGYATTKIAVAQWIADVGTQRYGAADVHVVANAVDVEHFTAPPRGKQRPPTVGLMYAQTPWKGTDVAIDAFRIAARNVPNLRLVAFGHYEDLSPLPLPDGARYVCRPPQDQIPAIYASCDAWLFASRIEGFGLPILEAMACRTPVIGTPAGAAPELIAQGGGVLVKPQDPMDMAVAIERVCRLGDAEWRQLSDAARATAERNTWDDAATRFEQILLDAAARR